MNSKLIFRPKTRTEYTIIRHGREVTYDCGTVYGKFMYRDVADITDRVETYKFDCLNHWSLKIFGKTHRYSELRNYKTGKDIIFREDKFISKKVTTTYDIFSPVLTPFKSLIGNMVYEDFLLYVADYHKTLLIQN
jgi:hypothetical protein